MHCSVALPCRWAAFFQFTTALAFGTELCVQDFPGRDGWACKVDRGCKESRQLWALLCTDFVQYIRLLLGVRSKNLAGFTLMRYICRNHLQDFLMSTALMLCLDKSLKCMNRLRWQIWMHCSPALPNREVTICPGSCKGCAYGNTAGTKEFYRQGWTSLMLYFTFFSAPKWCQFLPVWSCCAATFGNSLCWTSPWCTIRFCFGWYCTSSFTFWAQTKQGKK